jgi:hypothetical protein
MARLPGAIAHHQVDRRCGAAADPHHARERISRLGDSDLDLDALLAERAPRGR